MKNKLIDALLISAAIVFSLLLYLTKYNVIVFIIGFIVLVTLIIVNIKLHSNNKK